MEPHAIKHLCVMSVKKNQKNLRKHFIRIVSEFWEHMGVSFILNKLSQSSKPRRTCENQHVISSWWESNSLRDAKKTLILPLGYMHGAI